MPATIFISQIPVDGDQRKLLAKLFTSPEYSMLKQIIIAQCIKSQAESLNTGLYEHNNEKAEEMARTQRLQAELYNNVLDVLDDIADKEEKWFTVKLEPRR